MGRLAKQYKRRTLKYNLPYILLVLPGVLWLIFFHYVPVFGTVLAFKEYNYRDGLFGSPWVGFKNFAAFFKSGDMWRIIRNTLGYNIGWLLLVNVLLGMVIALLLYEVISKKANKLYQTAMLIPNFVSFVVIAYIGYIILSPTSGVITNFMKGMGMQPINFYSSREAAKYWPLILTIAEAWKFVGMASLYYYAALLSIDTSLFEAASIDGAKKLKQIWYISIPELMPMACMTIIMKLGSVLGGTMDIFYQMTMDSGALYSTTETLAVYVYHGLAGKYTVGVTSAVGLFQSLVGAVMLILSNAMIKRINSNSAIY